jgi:regulator of protease activity HflC (stomatin/prohibitin superfamily)
MTIDGICTNGAMTMKERSITTQPGIPTLLAIFVLLAADAWMFAVGANSTNIPLIAGALVAGAILLICFGGFFNIEPNQAAVLSLFGKYIGTAREQGLRFTNPFYAVKKISLRIRNFESSKLKVNELEGSPIEIGAVIVWQVVDASEAVYAVDDFESYVHIQSESDRPAWS